MANVGYESLVKAIIRPPRAQYTLSDLGPSRFSISRREFQRKDFQIKNDRGLRLECSWWRPMSPPASTLPCVIITHGNSSCRLEATGNLQSLLTGGMTVFAFDFAGSGLSEGEHVSLGFHEQEDLKCVIAYLRSSKEVSTIGFWGRSMGAATALLYAHRDPSIAGMILDSSFADMYQLCREMVRFAEKQGWRVPGVLMAGAIRVLRNSVMSRVKGFDIYKLKPIALVDRAFIPALFVHGRSDDFILPAHSEQLHKAYAGEAEIMMVEGDHNSPRPTYVKDSAAIFLKTALRVPDAYAVPAESFRSNRGMFERVATEDTRGNEEQRIKQQEDMLIQEAIRLSLMDGKETPASHRDGAATKSSEARDREKSSPTDKVRASQSKSPPPAPPSD